MANGWTSNPTPRSEIARLRSSIFKGFGINEDFIVAWIVTLFSMMAVQEEKVLMTEQAV